MDLLIGPVTPFLNVLHQSEFLSITKLCGLPHDQEFKVFVSNAHIKDNGLIIGTEILLDELFIAHKIKGVYCVAKNDNKILKDFCNYYGVTCYEI